MGPELNLKPKLEASEKDSSICKENPNIPQSKGKSLDTEPSLVKPFLEPDRTQNVETNINEATHFSEVGMGESDRAETTEASSSFSNTESATAYAFEGDEAESGLRCEQNPMPGFDSCYNTFRMRNKKLTNHWRKFVRPLMWRCKWMELRMKELVLQALQYDKELAEYDKESQSRMNKLMKRHKRKRVEETVDTKSYMSQHNFFSYYENKKFLSDGDALEDDTGNPGTRNNHNSEVGSNKGFLLESRDEESSFEDLFRNIETVQSHVRKLITRVDVVVYTHTEKINSIKRLSNAITQNALGNTAQNPNVPSGCGDGLNTETVHFASQNTCGKNMGNELIRVRSVPSCSQENGTGKRLQVRDLFANSEDVLIDNELAKEELQDFEKFRHQFGGKSLVLKERKENPTLVLEADSLPSKALSVRAKGMKRKRKMSSRR